jgi:uncharacterized protein (DUF1810 family)
MTDPHDLDRFVRAQEPAYDIFGSPDDLKLRSCATLFAHVSPAGSVFEQLLDKYFQSHRDDKTLHLLETAG